MACWLDGLTVSLKYSLKPHLNSMDEEVIKTTLRLPKKLVKQLKQYGLDNDKTLTEIAIEAFNEYLARRKK